MNCMTDRFCVWRIDDAFSGCSMLKMQNEVCMMECSAIFKDGNTSLSFIGTFVLHDTMFLHIVCELLSCVQIGQEP